MDIPETQVPAVPSVPSHRRWVWIVSIVIVVAVIIAGAFLYWSQRSSSPSPDANAYVPYEPQNTPETYYGSTPIPTPVPHAGEVTFQAPSPYTNLDLFPPDTSVPASPSATPQMYQKIGTFTAGQYAGSDLVLATVQYDEPGPSGYLYRFAVKNGSATLLAQHSDYLMDTTSFKVDATYGIAELLYPFAFRSPDGSITFTRDTAVQNTWADYTKVATLKKIFTLAGYGDVFTDTYASGSQPENGFYLKAPDGTIRTYKMDIPFVPSAAEAQGKPSVTWSDGTVNTEDYAWTDHGGCGSINYASVVTSRDVADAALMVGGTTSTGDPILVFKDTNNPFLKNIYDNVYPGEYVENGPPHKVSYATFTAEHPVFFWRDRLGRLIKFMNFKFMVQAECGKPVIYLYPRETTRVSVHVSPRGGMTASEPAYGDGWTVTAEPSGRLTDVSGTVWPYLFWEGRGGIYARPDQGWVVPQDGVKELLEQKLAAFGFNAHEIADFEEFWLPRMHAAPYYFVTFMGNSFMDELAPLSVQPKPDTVIRVLMDYQPLQQPISAQGFDIRTPERRGFTVIEWGGVLGR